MRLPTLTDDQRHREDARQIHERLWSDYQESQVYGELTLERLRIPSTPETVERDLVSFSGKYHGFWKRHGFKLRTKRLKDQSAFHAWIEPRNGNGSHG